SLFLATPLLADLKEREPQYKALQQRVLARRSGTAPKGATKFQQRAAARAAGTPQPVAAETVAVADEAAVTPPAVTPKKAPTGGAGRRPGNQPKKKSKGGRPSGKKRR